LPIEIARKRDRILKMDENNTSDDAKTNPKRFGCLQVLVLIFITAILAVGVTIFAFKAYFFPSEFKPVSLNASEEKVLEAKLAKIDSIEREDVLYKSRETNKTSITEALNSNNFLKPEPYREEGATRQIEFSERELNGLLAKNTDLAKKVAIDLSDNLISAKILLPVDEDFPIFGGRLFRLRTGIAFTFTKGKPVIILKGITIMGVPVPNAWMGGIKNIDLVEEFAAEKGFWKTFSGGVEKFKVEEGRLKIKLKE